MRPARIRQSPVLSFLYSLICFDDEIPPRSDLRDGEIRRPEASLMNAQEKSFLKSTAIYGIGGIALQLAGVVLLPLYVNYLTPEEFGILDLISQTSSIVMICLMVNGMRTAALTFYQQARVETGAG